ncbi:MAG TPA: class I SAM-dependent methyltransferase [Vicinamibacterales bacterium]|nr:class I SAM-dependent methyltransferase [Vicinamibacterales bacterium]
MCNQACLEFARKHLTKDEVCGRDVLEVGSYDDNGSLRAVIEAWGPRRYVGVDIYYGPGVDVVCDAAAVAQRFGPGSFDLVVSTEMLEHVQDWRTVIRSMKAVLRPGGAVLITTRSNGYPYHGAPFDCWRFEVEDMKVIFGDFEIEAVEPDPLMPGVFVKARKPEHYAPADLGGYALYSMAAGARVAAVPPLALHRYLIEKNGAWRYANLRLRQTVSAFVPLPLKRLKRRLYGERV